MHHLIDTIKNEKKNNNKLLDKIPKKDNTNKINQSPHELKQINFRSYKYKNTQLKQLEQKISNSEEEINHILNIDQQNIYLKPWKQLEKGFKKTKINEYLDKLQKIDNSTKLHIRQLKDILYQYLQTNHKLDTLILYNTDEGLIEDIKNIEYIKEKGYILNISKLNNLKKIKKIDTLNFKETKKHKLF